MSKKKKDKLNESPTTTLGYPSFGGVVGDDDHPPGNIVFGHRYNKARVYNRLTGSYNNFFVDDNDDWKWDIFTGLKGMQDRENYHDSLERFNEPNSPIKRDNFDIWKHVKTKEKDHKWVANKERLREPEQKGHELGKDEVEVADNPETGKDDKDWMVEKYMK